MSSSNASANEALAAPSALAAQGQTTTISGADGAHLLEEDGELEADDDDRDSATGTDSSDTTSITSSIFKGIVEHGRKYQALREGEYWGPSDEKQLESMEAAHIVYTLLEANQKNPFFRSPLPETAQNVLDLGTGTGEWARQVADMFPSGTPLLAPLHKHGPGLISHQFFVQGVDLAPPPNPYVPPNCKFEVDDVLKPWLFQQRFDLIHMRDMIGAFSDEQWRLVYKQAYDNMLPGGWIEHLETDFRYLSNNGGNKPGSICAQWNDIAFREFTRMGKNVDTISTCRAAMETAGYTNIQEKWYQAPVGDWVKNPLLKEIGKYKKRQAMEGLEGYLMFVLTKFGEPEPWSAEEAQAFLAKVKNELNDPKLQFYVLKRRVWGMKPLS